MPRQWRLPVLLLLAVFAAGCQAGPAIEIAYEPDGLRFSGRRALATAADFVDRFPHRDSGQPNNQLAVAWLREQLEQIGLRCSVDEWEVVNYSRPLPLRNVICTLDGQSAQEIWILAHHDQSPDTVQGADNDASGIAILLQLAEIFAAEPRPSYTLVFAAVDGEEYGMLGSRRLVQTHPEPGRIVAGFSLDNVGKQWYAGLGMSPVGQFRGIGPLWLMRTAQQAAVAAGDVWVPQIRAPIDQVLNQAVPVSQMDQGPLVAAGIPAFGFYGLIPPEHAEQVWDTYHTPADRIEYQSADVLQQAGRATEAAIRQLLGMDRFPEERGAYIYLAGRDQVLRGLPLWLIFAGFGSLFWLISYVKGAPGLRKVVAGWRQGLPHLLANWLPVLGAILLTYLLVAVGLMDAYELYPATAKDEPIFEPRWPAVTLFLLGLSLLFFAFRRLSARYGNAAVSHRAIASLAFLAIGLSALFILATNPFGLLFMVPLLFWTGIAGRRGTGLLLDLLLFALGGLMVYLLLYFFGFVILRNDFAILWYLMMMFSIRMISLPMAVVISLILGAGISLVVPPARPA